MNTLVIVLIAAVCLFCGYTFYGRWLANKWGIDPKAKTPAVALEDGQDYVPTDGWTVFAHQFSSIAGAGPVTGAIQAAVFGWVPVLLWILIGGIFFGAVTDFGALYASVKNDGFAPVPWHVVQVSFRLISSSFWHPKTASSNVMWTTARRFAPFIGPLFALLLLPPPPNRSPKISPKISPISPPPKSKPPNPPAPAPPPPFSNAAWPN